MSLEACICSAAFRLSRLLIGAVGFAQVIKLINDRDSDNEKRAGSAKHEMKLSIRGSMLTGHDFKRLLPPGHSVPD